MCKSRPSRDQIISVDNHDDEASDGGVDHDFVRPFSGNFVRSRSRRKMFSYQPEIIFSSRENVAGESFRQSEL